MHVAQSSPDAIRPVFVIGSLVVACCARVPRCPEPGESLRASDFFMEAGGKGFNVALAALRLDVPVDGLFAVGDDAPGAFMRAAFAKAGLPTGAVMTVAGSTGAGIGLIEASGENRIAVFPGVNDLLSAEHVLAASDRVRRASIVVAQFEAPDAPIAAAFAIARQAGVTTLLNPSPYRRIDPALLATTDILVVNESEARAIAADLDAAESAVWTGPHGALAHALRQRGVDTLIVTMGRDGALMWQNGAYATHPGLIVDAVDTIGAGDAFTGGVIAALSRKLPITEGLRWGCAAGGFTVSRLGLVEALPRLTELTPLLAGGSLSG